MTKGKRLLLCRIADLIEDGRGDYEGCDSADQLDLIQLLIDSKNDEFSLETTGECCPWLLRRVLNILHGDPRDTSDAVGDAAKSLSDELLNYFGRHGTMWEELWHESRIYYEIKEEAE